MPSARIYLPPGDYTGVGITGGTVPTLTVGTLNRSGTIGVGTSITYTPSHALSSLSSVEWLRNGSTVVGTGLNYTTVAGDAGATISARESLGDKQSPVTTGTVSVSAQVDATVTDNFESGQGVTSVTRTNAALGAADAGREILVVLSGHFLTALPAATDYTCTVQGIDAGSPVYTYRPTRWGSHFVWRVAVPTGTTGTIVISRAAGSSSFYSGSVQVIRLTGSPTLDTAGAVTVTNSVQNGTFTLSQTVAQGSAVIGGWGTRNNATSITWNGLTSQRFAANGASSVAFASNVTAGTRTMDVTPAGETGSGFDKSAFSMEITA